MFKFFSRHLLAEWMISAPPDDKSHWPEAVNEWWGIIGATVQHHLESHTVYFCAVTPSHPNTWPNKQQCLFTSIVVCQRIKKFWPTNIISPAVIFCVVHLKSATQVKEKKKHDISVVHLRGRIPRQTPGSRKVQYKKNAPSVHLGQKWLFLLTSLYWRCLDLNLGCPI